MAASAAVVSKSGSGSNNGSVAIAGENSGGMAASIENIEKWHRGMGSKQMLALEHRNRKMKKRRQAKRQPASGDGVSVK